MKRNETNWKELAKLLGVFVLCLALWNTWAMYPLRILVVFLHEMSHGLAAVLTGGRIVQIQATANEGGLCMTAGGNRFLTLSAGYLGSMVWGGMVLLGASRPKARRPITILAGCALLVVSLLWVRPIFGFGFPVGVLIGVLLLAAGEWLPESFLDFLLKIIGLTSCLYAALDIKSDILDRPYLESDASMLAGLTGVPAWAWGTLWLAVSVAVSFQFLRMACSGPTAGRPGAVGALPPIAP